MDHSHPGHRSVAVPIDHLQPCLDHTYPNSQWQKPGCSLHPGPVTPHRPRFRPSSCRHGEFRTSVHMSCINSGSIDVSGHRKRHAIVRPCAFPVQMVGISARIKRPSCFPLRIIGAERRRFRWPPAVLSGCPTPRWSGTARIVVAGPVRRLGQRQEFPDIRRQALSSLFRRLAPRRSPGSDLLPGVHQVFGTVLA